MPAIPLPPLRPARAVRSPPSRSLLAVAVCIGLVGCAGTRPLAYAGLPSASELRPNPRDASGRIPLKYAPSVDWSAYRNAFVEPVTIYRGRDAQFGKVDEADQAALARAMQAEFSRRLRTRFAPGAEAAPGTARVRLTLTGAEASNPVLGPFSRVDMLGGAYNGIQAVRGGQGSMTGSVSYAVEVYDAASDKLLLAYVSKQYPNAMNIGATFGRLGAAMAGIRKGADALLEEMR